MPEEKIVLVLEIKGKGSSGVTKELKRVEGTVKDLDDKLKELSKSTSGYGNIARSQFNAARAAISKVAAEAARANEKISEINVKGIGTKKARLRATRTDTGAELQAKRLAKEVAKAHDEALRIQQRIDKESARSAERSARERTRAQQQAAREIERLERQRRQQESRNLRDQEKDRRDQERKAEATLRRRVATAERTRLLEEKERSERNKNIRITAGFLGINTSQQLGGILDNVKAKGVFAGGISKVAGSIGSIFGNTFGSVFANLGDFIGKLGESVIDIFGSVFRSGAKFISGFLVSIFTSLISFNPIALILGVIGGIVTGIISALGSLLKDAVEIVGNLFNALSSLLSAGFQVIRSIFDGFFGLLKGLWNAFWDGLKSIAEFSMDAVTSAISFGLDIVSQGFAKFVESEKLATGSFVNIADQAQAMGISFQEGVEKVRKMGNAFRTSFGTGAADTQGALFDVLSGGFRDLADANKVVGASAKLAQIGQDGLKETTAAVASTLLAYGKGAQEAEHFASVLFATSNLGRFSLKGLNSALGTVINQAAIANVPLEELGAAISAISLSGVSVNQATVGLNRLLLAMINPTKGNTKAFNEMGLSFTKAGADGKVVSKSFRELIDEFQKVDETKLRAAFGTSQGIKAFLALRNNAGRFKEILQQIPSISKNFDKTFKETDNTFAVIISKAIAVKDVILENIGRVFGQIVRGPARELLPYVQAIGKAFESTNFDKFTKVLETFSAPIFAAILGPIKSILGDVDKFISNGDLSSIFKTEGAIKIRNAFVDVINFVARIPLYLEESWNIFESIYDIAKFTFDEIIIPAIDYMGNRNNLKGILDVFLMVKNFVLDIKDIFVGSFDGNRLVDNFNIFFEFMYESIASIGNFLAETFKNGLAVAADFFGATIGPKIQFALSESFSKISSSLSNQSLDARKNGNNVESLLLGNLSSAFGGLAKASSIGKPNLDSIGAKEQGIKTLFKINQDNIERKRDPNNIGDNGLVDIFKNDGERKFNPNGVDASRVERFLGSLDKDYETSKQKFGDTFDGPLGKGRSEGTDLLFDSMLRRLTEMILKDAENTVGGTDSKKYADQFTVGQAQINSMKALSGDVNLLTDSFTKDGKKLTEALKDNAKSKFDLLKTRNSDILPERNNDSSSIIDSFNRGRSEISTSPIDSIIEEPKKTRNLDSKKLRRLEKDLYNTPGFLKKFRETFKKSNPTAQGLERIYGIDPEKLIQLLSEFGKSLPFIEENNGTDKASKSKGLPPKPSTYFIDKANRKAILRNDTVESDEKTEDKKKDEKEPVILKLSQMVEQNKKIMAYLASIAASNEKVASQKTGLEGIAFGGSSGFSDPFSDIRV